MPPVRRPIPRFIASASVEGLPYGRWGARLRDEFAKACEPHISEAGGPPGEVTWFPERAWGGRVDPVMQADLVRSIKQEP